MRCWSCMRCYAGGEKIGLVSTFTGTGKHGGNFRVDKGQALWYLCQYKTAPHGRSGILRTPENRKASTMALLTAAGDNAKTAKDGKNILGAIQHLPPYTKSGANFCAFAHKANDKEAREFLENGGNIAVVFAVKKGDPLPETFWGFPVHDADKSDWRFQDATGGTVQGVRSKGKAKGVDS